MNLNMIQPKNEIEDLLLSITKNCEKLVEQTHRKPEHSNSKCSNREKHSILVRLFKLKEIEMIGLINLEVYNSIFNITEENNKFEIYRDTSNKFGFLELKDELEEILNISHITTDHLDDEIIGPRIIDEYIKLSNEKKNSDGYMVLLLGYCASSFRDFESYLRLVVGLDEEDIQLILKEYNSHFITYELTPGIYTNRDISDAIQTFSGHQGTIQLEYDDISKRTTIILKFRNEKAMFALGTLRFDKQSFFHTLLGFSPYWDYKPNNSNHVLIPGVYPSDFLFR